MVTLRHSLMSSLLSSLLRGVKILPQRTLFPINSVPRNTSLPRNVAITPILTQTWIVVALGTRPMGIRNRSILVLILSFQLKMSLGENQVLHQPVVLKARRTGLQGGGRGVSVSTGTGCTVMQWTVYIREFFAKCVHIICADLISILKVIGGWVVDVVIDCIFCEPTVP